METKPNSSLVNTDRLFGVVRRLFTGSLDEIVGELLQNAQRSGATEVDIRVSEDRITFSDNGSGLKDGAEGFRKLLSIGESDYTPEVEAAQTPMGIGFYALLSHSAVIEVRIRSAGKELAINPARWFSDAKYRHNWVELLTECDHRYGTSIQAKCRPELIDGFSALFQEKWWVPDFALSAQFRGIPAWVGYGNWLRITFNGEVLPAELPDFLKLEVLFETEYLGNRLTVGMKPGTYSGYGQSFVNWFGKLIEVNGLGHEVDWRLSVTGNNPVTPRSPTRDGIVSDDKWKALRQFLIDRTREYFEHLQTRPEVEVLQAGYCLFPELAEKLPWIIARKAQVGEGTSHQYRFLPTEYEILPKNGDFHLLDWEIDVLDDAGRSNRMGGLESFLPLLDKPAYFHDRGGRTVTAVAWKPGPLVRNDIGVEVRERGQFCVLDDRGEPGEWMDVTRDVFAYEQPVAFDITDCGLVVGATNPIQAIQDAATRTFEYHPDIEDSWATANQCFSDSVHAVLRKLKGNVVPLDFSQSDLREFVPKGRRIRRVEYKYLEGTMSGLKLVLNKGKSVLLGIF